MFKMHPFSLAFGTGMARAPEDGAGAAEIEGSTAAPGTDAPAPEATTAPAPKWYETEHFDPDMREWLGKKGITGIDDPAAAAARLAKGHRMAEQRIGKGLESIMDRPAKDQSVTDFMKQNAEVFGLPADADGYKMDKPDFWPKEAAWDDSFDDAARKFAHENGVPPAIHKAYVGLYAKQMAALVEASEQGLKNAEAQMMTELKKEWGGQTPARLMQARQAADYAATEAGLSPEAKMAVMQMLSEKTGGDAVVARMFQAIGAAMAEDRAVGIGTGGTGTMTPAEAKAELARFTGPEGEYGKAFAANDVMKLRELSARRAELAKFATQ